MGYLAIARKWRPSRFEDLVGQNHVVQTLKNAIAFQRVTHAYLFSGPRGVGKTSVARIFAMALRCPTSKDGTPCNSCEECRAISESRSVDVVEIDGASNNGVEAIRGIRENVAYSASSGTYKIYIIDEVHMLSISAFNALLKTLEEPPPHIIFIFATTEVHKIPLTILSRCQRFEFRRLTNLQIVNRLAEILKAENITLSEDALGTLASYGDGSLRDSLSLLDQVLSYFGQAVHEQTLSEQQVVEALGITDTSTATLFLSHILKRDSRALIQLIGEIYQGGADLKRFAERCLEEVRLLYLITLAREEKESVSAEILDISSSHHAQLAELAENSSIVQLERMAQILGKTITQLGWSSLPRFVLEMAGVRMSHLDSLARIEQALMNQQPVPVQTATQSKKAAVETPVRPAQRPAPPVAEPPPPSREDEPSPEHLEDEPSSMPGEPGTRNWKSFVDAVMKKRPILGALLCHAEFRLENQETGRKTAVLTFAKDSFYEQQAVETKNRTEIIKMFREHFGNDTELDFSFTFDTDIKSIEQSRQTEAAQIKKEAVEHPSVVQMKDALGAEVVDVNIKIQEV